MWLNMIGTQNTAVGEITPTQFDYGFPPNCFENWSANLQFPDNMSFSWSTSPDVTGSTGGKRTKIAHHTTVTPTTISSWDINDSLAADFDGSLSGLGSEIGSGTYNMSEALLALPVFKQENLDNGFQYILGAATSPAVKMNEETLTYLNQGQSYEIKVKKLGDLSEFQGKLLRSVVKISFHERRLQYMEKEQLDSWKINRPGERILDIDIPLSYGLVDIQMDGDALNTAEFIWDPTKETGVYVRVFCISTEFTAKKHGGEKGVPFRLQIETYSYNPDDECKLLHCASSQVKVFKPKGADRKHKTDREKMDKRSEAEKEKYQPSYECTVLTEVPLDQVVVSQSTSTIRSPGSFTNLSQRLSEMMARSPTNKLNNPIPVTTVPVTPSTANGEGSDNSSDHGSNNNTPNTTSTLPSLPTLPTLPTLSTVPVCTSLEPQGNLLASDASAKEVTQWLQANRFSNYIRVFQNFSGADLLRLSRDDFIQICGLADGIRLNNALQSRAVRPRLTIYVCQETDSVYHALYIETLTSRELVLKLARLYNVLPQQIGELYCQGPSGIYVLVNDEVVSNLHDQARFCVEAMKADTSADLYKVLLKTIP